MIVILNLIAYLLLQPFPPERAAALKNTQMLRCGGDGHLKQFCDITYGEIPLPGFYEQTQDPTPVRVAQRLKERRDLLVIPIHQLFQLFQFVFG